MFLASGDPHPFWLASFLIINTMVRLFMPSQYAPPRQTYSHFFSSPYFARTLATIAEPLFLEVLAACIGLEFWGAPMGYLTILGECICWSCLLLQSKILGELEDACWMLIQMYGAVYGKGPFVWLICRPFGAYLLFYHLPRMLRRK